MATSEVIHLNNVRLSFPQLAKAKAFRPGQEARYEAAFLLDPSNKTHAATIKQIKAAAKAVLEEHFNGKIPKGIKFCFGDADKNGKEYDGYEGMFYITSSKKESQGRPTVVDRDRSPLTAEDGKP